MAQVMLLALASKLVMVLAITMVTVPAMLVYEVQWQL